MLFSKYVVFTALLLTQQPSFAQLADSTSNRLPYIVMRSSNPDRLLALQSGSVRTSAITADGAAIELINLNPSIGRWLLLSLPDAKGTPHWVHLDLGHEGVLRAGLGQDGNLMIEPRTGKSMVCSLKSPAARAVYLNKYSEPFTSACLGALFIRSTPAKGYKSNMESVTDWLREQGPIGEALITLRKDLLPHQGDEAEAASGPTARASMDGPAVSLAVLGSPLTLSTVNLGLKTASHAISPGSWLPVLGAPGVWTSISAPGFSPSITPGYQATTSLAYFIAIETNTISPHYSVGVDHPSLGWSTRAPGLHEGPGPDGFDTVAPLERVGMVPPWALNQLVAVISGGFKREHSAFKAGPLSTKNHGSHYGFAEAGVVLSHLNPGVATFFQRLGETPQIKTWSAQDESRGSNQLIFARQNGLVLVENYKPGPNLAVDFKGNWSGNQEGNANTLRSALCTATREPQNFMIYGVFSNATPKDMAQLLVSYHCKDAMQLDMNAPVLSYASVVTRDAKGGTQFMPLLESMNDKNLGGMGRFIGTPDSRDFIYFERQ